MPFQKTSKIFTRLQPNYGMGHTVWPISPVAFVIILPFFKKFFDFEFVKYKLGNTTDS